MIYILKLHVYVEKLILQLQQQTVLIFFEI